MGFSGTSTNMYKLIIASLLAVATALPIEDTAEVAEAKAVFNAAFAAADAGEHAALAPVNADAQAAQIAAEYLADAEEVAAAKAAFQAEYGFTPNTVVASLDNYVHTQWTGSDNNPNNNAGQGKAGTDRSNIALLKELSYAANGQENMSGHASQFGNSIPRHIDEVKFAGFTREDLVKMSVFSPKHLGGDMDELDDSGTYFDLGPRKVTRSGEFHFMCMRNNNFSNRSQKGKLHVLNGKYAGKQVDNRGGKLRSPEVTNNPTAVEVPPLALQTSQFIELWEQPTDLINKTRSPPVNDYVTNMITINPQEKISDSNPLAVEIKLTGSLGFVDNVFVYRRVGADADWFHVEVDEVREGKVMFRTHSGGHFVVAKTLNASHVAVVVIAVLISVIVLAVVVYNLMKKDFTYFKHKI